MLRNDVHVMIQTYDGTNGQRIDDDDGAGVDGQTGDAFCNYVVSFGAGATIGAEQVFPLWSAMCAEPT